jgi:hypothetical protein
MIVVGLPIEEIDPETFDPSDAEDKDLMVVSPYYDAPYSDSLVGVLIASAGSYSWEPLDVDGMPAEIEKARALFKRATGLDARVFITTYGY